MENNYSKFDFIAASYSCLKHLHFKKISFLIAFVMCIGVFNSFGQTTLLSPTVNNGGFETDLTGWSTAQNSVTKGAWYSGTATVYAGTKSAYISTDTGTTNSYTSDGARFQHLYRAIAFPAGETIINLSFYWKALGEGPSNDWDNLKVFVSNTIPTAGTANVVADLIGATWYNQQTTWQNVSLTLPAAYAGTTKYLIFQWKHDGSVTNNPPAAVDNITLTSQALAACTGAPTGGLITVSPSSGIVGSTYGITASGFTTGTGLTYQWQYSDTGAAPWTNQGAATSSYAALTGMIAPAFGVVRTWRLVVTCTASSTSTASSTGTFTSSYCTSIATSSADSMISNVTFNTINNTTSACATYSNFTAISTNVIKTSTYNLTIAKNDCDGGTNFTGRFAAWIDWNQNGVFESTEQVLSDASASIGPITVSVTIPGTALNGITRMRCIFNESAVPNSCGTYTWGETEDYNINIITPVLPTISSFTPSSQCASSSATVVITGTDFIGTTAVTIGGTAVASFIVNSATQITATVGTGTTGTIAVTTGGGTATSAATFTVNPLPANPGNPTSNSPQCNPPGVTLTRTGTPPAGVTWYWQTTAGGTATTNSAATNLVTTSGTYYIRAQNDTTLCWSSGTGSLAIIVTPNITAIAGTPNPANSATDVCYAGSGPVTSTSWSAVTGAASYDVYFGAGSLPGTITANVTTNSFTTGTLLASTTYYWQIIPKNDCGITSGTPITWSFTTSSTPCYCTSSATNTADSMISNVTFNTINNTTSACATYSNFTAISTTVLKTLSYNLTIAKSFCPGGTNYSGRFAAWIDWNQNGVFEPTEQVLSDASASTGPITVSVTIPSTALNGITRMRCVFNESNIPSSCGTYTWGETEDYNITVMDIFPCVSPTSQPTALILTPTSNTIIGSFTAASPAPNSYLVVVSTSASPPTPTNGTTYTIGGTVGLGYNVVDTDSNTTFTATGLAPITLYYVYVFSFNNACTGGPLYLNTSPLSGSTTTLNPTYCTPTTTSSSNYISGIRSVGSLVDATNIPTGYSPSGYGNYSSTIIATQAPLGPINIEINLVGTQFIKAYIDWNKNGTLDDTTPFNELVYDTGTIATGDTTFGFIVPAGVTAGTYRMRIRTRAFSSSTNFTNPCNSYDLGETEDYTITIVNDCAAKITSVVNGSNCGNGTVTLGAVGTSGTTGFKWYANSTDTVPLATTGTGSWTTPSLSTTTTYYVTALNASPCESLTKTPVKATIKPTTNITFTPSAPLICGDNTIITISAAGDIEEVDLINEDFEGGLGIFSSTIPTSVNGGADSPWSVKTSTYQPATTIVFKPALSSGSIGNRFAFTTSEYQNSNIETNLTSTTSINTSTFTSLTLTFRHYYSYFNGDSGRVQVSTNGGTSWTTLTGATYTSDIGSPSKFDNVTIGMNAYIGQSNLMIRFNYRADWDDGWALDDVRLFGTRPLTAAFTWSGATVDAYIDAAATIPYTTQSASTLYIKPTPAQLELSSWTFTGTVTLSNSCSVSSPLTVTNNTKVWQGITADWNTASNWKPDGIPTINNCIVIPNNTVISGPAYTAYGKNLRVKSAGSLNIQPLNNLIIADEVIVETGGTFQIENNSNLVQINNTTNSGNIIYKRIAPSIKGSDYVYWSSPVNSQAINSIYTSPAQGPKYSWNTLVDNGNGTGGNISQGNWANPTATMATGSGYIIRGSSSFGMSAANINASFTGRPNNGNISVTINRGDFTGVDYTGANGTLITNLDDNYNLLGNPYPSAINAYRFIYDNSSVIEGHVKLWTHGTNPGLNNGLTITNPFYGTYTYNYSAGDYMSINYTGTTIPTASASIKAGQGFFVTMKDGTAGSGTVEFNNIQRRDASGTPYANDNFFKNSNQQTTDINEIENLERHRIWLDLLDSNNVSERTLVGYVQGATLGSDSNYDALADPLTMGIYSKLNNKSFVIQGRSLPFDDNDQVAIGFNVPTAGTYRIGINTVDGLFLGTQNIYLKDELLNVFHDLKSAPYSFTTTAGSHDTRFKLVYKNTALSNETFNQNEIQIAKNRNIIEIVSGNEIMDNVKVFDVRGRLLVEKSKINANSISVDMNSIQDQVLIVNIVTSEGIKVTRKIL